MNPIKNLTYFLSIFVLNLGFTQNLKLDLEVGKTYYQTAQNHFIMTQKIENEESTVETGINGKMSFKVTGKDLDSYHLDVKFQTLEIDMKSPFGDTYINSNDSSSTDVFSKLLRQMISSTFKVKMFQNGFVKEIDMDSLFSGLLESFPEIPRFQKRGLIEKLKQAYGEKAFKGNLEMITAIFPNKKVNINDKWRNEIKLESGMSAQMKNEFTLKEYNKKFALIELNSATKTNDKDSYVPINGNPMKYNLHGTMKGVIKIDTKTGWIIDSEMVQDFKGTIEMKDAKNNETIYSVPTTFDNKMIIKGN